MSDEDMSEQEDVSEEEISDFENGSEIDEFSDQEDEQNNLKKRVRNFET